MTEDLMESVAPQLAPPVTRHTAATAGTQDGVDSSMGVVRLE